MPALDSCHYQVAYALRKEGWQVNDKPTYIDSDAPIYIDLAASKATNGINTRRNIYVEVKCFPGKNPTQELYIAFGQYLIYRAILADNSLTVPLYLAVPSTIDRVLLNTAVWRAIHDNQIKVILIDLQTETVAQWIE